MRMAALGGAGEPLVLAGSLDDQITVAVPQHGACVALLFPELRDPLLEVEMLRLQRRVVPLGERAHHVYPALRQMIDLLSDVVQRSHTG